MILIVEDEPKIAQLLVDYLRQANYPAEVLAEGTGVAEWVRRHAPDLVLLDWMLPGKDGLTICREIRAFSDVPIIMVTARVEEIDRLLGLELGADDYVCKPFNPREVVARVKAVLRRQQRGQAPAAGLVLDEAAHRASLRGRPLDLTPVEFRLLKTLAGAPGRVFSRDALMDSAYADNRLVADRTIDSHVKNLRKKLKPLLPEGQEEAIESVYGVGYRWDM